MECCMVTIATNKNINHSHKHYAEQNLFDRGIDAILLYLILFHLHKV